MMPPMTILYLDHAPIWGGAEAVLVNLLSRLDRSRFRPLVATPAEAYLSIPLKETGIPQTSVTYGKLNQSGILFPVHLAHAVWQIIRITRQERIGLIHTNTVRTHIVGALAGALMGLPVVWTIHDNTFPPGLYRRLASIPRKIIAVSNWLADYYGTPASAGKTVVIPNGLKLQDSTTQRGSVRAELNIPSQAPLILNVGRLVAGKAPHLFIESACAVLKERPDAHFVLVGGPDTEDAASVAYAASLNQAALNPSSHGQIHLVGQRTDVERFYADADLFVYNAVQPEGLPTVILEAMQHQLPVIASAIGGAQEIIQDAVNGRLVAADDQDALAQTVLQLLSNETFRRQLAATGLKQLHDAYTLDRQVERTQALYAALCPEYYQ